MLNAKTHFFTVVFFASLLHGYAPAQNAGGPTATPIKHLVVIFDENVSFDHYFATYPHALNRAATGRLPFPGPLWTMPRAVAAMVRACRFW